MSQRTKRSDAKNAVERSRFRFSTSGVITWLSP